MWIWFLAVSFLARPSLDIVFIAYPLIKNSIESTVSSQSNIEAITEGELFARQAQNPAVRWQ